MVMISGDVFSVDFLHETYISLILDEQQNVSSQTQR